MKCPECTTEQKLSSVYRTLGVSDLIAWTPFEDEDGNLHFHDPNKLSESFNCSRGHNWNKRSRDTCQVSGCDWNDPAHEVTL